jgi:hypothetical protein
VRPPPDSGWTPRPRITVESYKYLSIHNNDLGLPYPNLNQFCFKWRIIFRLNVYVCAYVCVFCVCVCVCVCACVNFLLFLLPTKTEIYFKEWKCTEVGRGE